MDTPVARLDALHAALATVSPGTPLREGLDRIVRAKMGALLVLGDDPDVLAICTGGFLLDAPFSPQRLSELAKMDGAIILSDDLTRIARANVHLLPDPTVPTSETGTRHRTAERVARSLDVAVVAVSEEMGVINVYTGAMKHQVQDIGRLLDRANQALQTLERYKVRLDDSLASLTSLELSDLATARDVAAVVQRGELVRRISTELETMIVELGVDARLLRLQLEELSSDIAHECALVAADYPQVASQHGSGFLGAAGHGAGSLGAGQMAAGHLEADDPVTPRGLRLLSRVHGLGHERAQAIVEHFGDLATVMRSAPRDLLAVEGIDLTTAVAVKSTLERLTESSILDQYS